MFILAIEQSTDIGSVAVLKDGQVLAERSWVGGRRSNHDLFGVVPQLLAETMIDLNQVDVYAAGLGPGSYTGLRASLMALKAFALPDRREIYGINSAEVLAAMLYSEERKKEIIIIGDARRQQLWLRRFIIQDGSFLSDQTSWVLTALEKLPSLLTAPALLASPDWEKIGASLKTVAPRNVTLLEKRVVPCAGWLGKLVAERMAKKIYSEPLAPIYLHAAVSKPAS